MSGAGDIQLNASYPYNFDKVQILFGIEDTDEDESIS